MSEKLSMILNGGKIYKSSKEQPQCCVHRDYHCRNLLFDGTHFGIVDFQDALHGPVLYDIASLLQDCYHVFPPAVIKRGLQQYVELQPLLADADPALVSRWFDFTAIQRQLKAAGIFARLDLRDNKSSHLRYIRPLLNRILHLTTPYPELQPIKVQLESCIKSAATHPKLADTQE